MPVRDYEATSMPEGNVGSLQSVGKFDLLNLLPGQTLEIKTRSSTYWATATSRTRLTTGSSAEVTGVSVVTNSVSGGRFTKNPNNTSIGRYVEIDQRFVIGRKADGQHARTSTVELLLVVH